MQMKTNGQKDLGMGSEDRRGQSLDLYVLLFCALL